MAMMKIGTQEVLKIMFGTEEVSSLAIGEETIPVDGGGGSDYSKMPLTFEVLSEGTITLTSSGQIERKVNYSVNDGETTTLEFTSAANKTYTITVVAGDVVEFTVPKDQNGVGETTSKYIRFGGTSKCNVYGNIMSLCYVNYQTNSLIPSNYCFYRLFRQFIVISAENLILPAEEATNNCYQYMFNGCTSLTVAPELPATSIGTNSYGNMFDGCTSLTVAPELPATTLSINCYVNMFNGCTSLTAAPELPAKSLLTSCYSYMFQGCTSLTTAPSLSATAVASSCYANMFKNCTSLTTAPELPATTLESNCYQKMFQGCTSLTAAPELNATAMKAYCYGGMFSGCTSLNYVKCIAGSTSSSSSFADWLNGVSATGTFVKAAGVSWPTGASGIPDGWTVQEV